MGIRAKMLELSDDTQEAVAGKRGIYHQPQLGFPPLLERAGQQFQTSEVRQQRTCSLEKDLPMCGQYRLAPFQDE